MRMNKVSMHALPEGLFKVFALCFHTDLSGRSIPKKVCLQTAYSIDYADARQIYLKLEELNPNLELHSTFTING